MKGGLIHRIPNKNLGLSRNKSSIPPQARKLVEYLCFDDNKFISSNTYNIYGSFNYRLQNYPSDIDSTNLINYNVEEDEAIKLIEANIKKLVYKLHNNKLGRTFADYKCGTYPNGESIHWSIDEILKGVRIANKPDINNQSSSKNISLYDAILDKGALMKLDMIAPYMGRYVEVSCMQQIKIKNVNLTHTQTNENPDDFLINLAIDTGKQYKKNKLFKVIKRMYSNAKLRKDIKMLRILEPLINSNLSKLASIKADIGTLLLLLSNGHFPSAIVLKQEISRIKFSLDNILDIDIDFNLLYKQLDNVYKLLMEHNENSIKLLELIENELNDIINKETILYLHSININSLYEFGNNYIIN